MPTASASIPTLSAFDSWPKLTKPPVPAPPGAAYISTPDGTRFYTSITGSATHGIVWFVLGPETPSQLPYGQLTKALHAAGFATALIHARGTGFSDGVRGDIEDYAVYLSDFQHFREHLESRSSRIFLFGQSVGAALALEIAASVPMQFAGLVLVNPAWKLTYAKGMRPTLRDFAAYAANYLFRPSDLTVDMNREPKAIQFIPDRLEGEAMQRDPCVVRYFSLRFVLGQRKIMKRCLKNLTALQAPILLVQGAHDALVDPLSFDLLLRAARASDKHKIIAPAGGHGSSAVETIVQPIMDWFLSRAR
jgi:alpha-beta hydrolase superfamily lysophospholipase